MRRLFEIRQTLFQDQWTFLSILILVGLLLGSGPGLSVAPAMDCSKATFDALGLKDEQFAQPVTITSAEISTKIGTTTVPEHCAVRGTMWPAIRFAIKLPTTTSTTTWNKRYYQVGNGGAGGSILESSMVPGLQMGYTTAGNDLGHDAATERSTWTYGPPWFVPPVYPDNPYAEQKLLDMAYRADHETNVLVRKLIKAYYGSDPAYAYYVGCSQGGKEGMVEAQQYPADFDGLIVGAAIQNTTFQFSHTWEAIALLGEGRIELDLLQVLADQVYTKCDGIDGLVDGLIDDPLKCNFDPARDLPVCPETNPCFTPTQIEALKKVYEGPKNSAGVQLGPKQVFGAEVFAPKTGWDGVIYLPLGGDARSANWWKQFAFRPAEPNFNWRLFNFDTDPSRMKERAALMDAVDTNLSQLKARGGKMIQYHGWNDTTAPPLMATNYYEGVLQFMGQAATKSFYKLYMVPGMFHCTGGVGCYKADYFTQLQNWVENGIEPKEIIGSRPATATLTARTRPLCPYPEVARYLGTGSIDDAANFTCAEIIPAASVRIIPTNVNLSRTRKFAALVRLPDGYNAKDLEISAVVCGGAPAGRVNAIGQTGIAWFNMEDVINPITPGDEVTFRVSVIANYNGQTIAFEGSDTVEVTE